MLVNTKIKRDDYIMMKLVDGEQVMGKLVSAPAEETVSLEKPRKLMITGGSQEQPELGLVPYIELYGAGLIEDTVLDFKKSDIITMGKLVDNLKNDYIRSVSSIQPANASDVPPNAS